MWSLQVIGSGVGEGSEGSGRDNKDRCGGHDGASSTKLTQAAGAPYDIKGFPTLKFFGEDKKAPKDYNSGRDAKAIVEFAL